MKWQGAEAAFDLGQMDDTIERVRRGEPVGTVSPYRGPETGERALMRAVLQDAILCLQGHATGVSARDRQRVAAQAYSWIVSREATWPFAFETICHVLGLDASSLRRRLLAAATTEGDPRGPGARGVWHVGGMVSALRAVRMRGNQRKGTLRLRERRRRRALGACHETATA